MWTSQCEECIGVTIIKLLNVVESAEIFQNQYSHTENIIVNVKNVIQQITYIKVI